VPQTLEDLLPTLAKLAARRGERRSLAELAREAGTSESTFQRAFSRIVGESPKQYTRRLQLERATLAS
jgi:AraC-like DNA-binding protein